MATQFNNVFLRSGGNLSLAFGTDPTRVFGSTAADVVTIAAGVSVVLDGSFNRGNDTIRFTGNAASYTIVRVNASTVRVTDALGTSVTIPVGSAGTAIEFADASRTLSGSSAGILLGDQAVTAIPATLTAGTAPAPVEEYVLTSSAPSIAESDGGTKTLTYLLTLDKAPTSDVTVNFQTTNTGTAAAGDDFEVAAGVVTFKAGQTATTVSITVYGDTVVEADETVVLRLSGSKLVAAVDAVGTIRNDDDAAVDPTNFTVTAGDIAIANAQAVPVTVEVGNSGARTVTIQSDGAAATAGVIITGDADTTVTAGAASDIITLSGNGDNTVTTGAGNDTVTVFGSGDNTINVGTGNDTVTTGAGNDTIVFASGALGEGDFVNAGGGNDTVILSGNGNVVVADAAGTGAVLTGVENIVLNGTTLTISAEALEALLADGLTSIAGSSATSDLIITGLSGTLNLTELSLPGGLKSITTTGNGTLVLTTEQDDNVGTIAAASGSTLTQAIVVSGAQTVAQAEALIANGVTAKFVLADTAANLALAPASVFAGAVSVEATTDANAAQAVQIAAVIVNSGNASIDAGTTPVDAAVKVNVTDTASMLANNVSGLAIADRVTATTTATAAEAGAIWGANALVGTVRLFTASYAVADTAAALGPVDALALNAATSVTVEGTASISDIASLNSALATAPGGLTRVEAGYRLNDVHGALTNSSNSAIVSAAGNVNVVTQVGGSTLADLTVAQAVAIEALANTGANSYKLSDTPTLLLGAGADVTAVATKVGGGVVATGSTMTVAQLNQLVAKFGSARFETASTVTDTAAEIVKLSAGALGELGANDIVFLSTSTATVAELTALNSFLTPSTGRIAQAPAQNTVKIADTAANLAAAVRDSTTRNALDASASVAVTGNATVEQISDINVFLNAAGFPLTAVVAGYTLVDNALNLAAANTAGGVVDRSAKVTVTGTATVAQVDAIADAFTLNGDDAVLGTNLVYSIRDTASNLLNGTTYSAGATSISVTDRTVTPAIAEGLRGLAKFDGVYAIEGTAAELNAANLISGAPNVDGRAALNGATSVTLVDSLTNLFAAGVAVPAQALADTVIASGSLSDLTTGNAVDKTKVDGFRIIGALNIATDVAASSDYSPTVA